MAKDKPQIQTTEEFDTEPERMAFDQETLARCQQFGRELMKAIPEMEGIAIIPSWTIPQEHVPFGIVMGRNGPLTMPQEIMHMAWQVHGCLRQMLENSYRVLKGIDAEMQRLAEEINDRQQQLAQLDAQRGPSVPSASPAERAAGGNPPGDPRPGSHTVLGSPATR